MPGASTGASPPSRRIACSGAPFPRRRVKAVAYGNVLAAVAFLHGLAAQELTPAELDYEDADFEVLIGVRAVKFDRS
jgi:hypothetical protein